MLLSWLERSLTYKPHNQQHADFAPFGFQKLERRGRLHTIQIFSKLSHKRPVVLFAHGNTGNVSINCWYYELFEKLGVSHLTFEYPGYGDAPGTPSEKGLYDAASTAYSYLVDEMRIKPQEIFLYGVSLGGAVMIDLASRLPSAGILLESVFNDSHSMGKRVCNISFMPFFVPNRFNNRKKIASVTTPLLLMHGGADPTTPVDFGLEVFDRHPGPKEKLIIDGAPHKEIGRIAPSVYEEAVRRFLKLP